MAESGKHHADDFNLAATSLSHGDIDTAICLFEKLATQLPNDFRVWDGLAIAYSRLNQFKMASIYFEKSLTLRPDDKQTLINNYIVYQHLDEIEKMLIITSRLITLFPNEAAFKYLYIDSLGENRKHIEAINYLQEMKLIDPYNPHIEMAAAQNLSYLGKYKEALIAYENRIFLQDGYRAKKDFGCPMWQGELSNEKIDILGKTFLIACEQGFGDAILAARYISLLRKKIGSHGKIIFQCEPPLFRLFEKIDADYIIGINQMPGKGNIPQPDYFCFMMTLIGALGSTPKNIPPPIDVHIPESSRKKFSTLANTDKNFTKIGIAWSGSPQFKNNIKRSLPLTDFIPLAKNKNHRLFSFQKTEVANELYTLGVNSIIQDIGMLCDDFADTAAALEHMDLIIMTDSSLAHLAGSMNKRVINLVNHLPYWLYWIQDGRTPWYPSMEFVNKNELGDFFLQTFDKT